jgi:transcriptional regulator with PAS, ATPase and Fis domain
MLQKAKVMFDPRTKRFGKRGIANTITVKSQKNKPLIKVNCGAIPDTLLESELFGI